MEFTMENIEEKLLEHKYWVWGSDKHYNYKRVLDYEIPILQTTVKWKRLVETLVLENTITNREQKTIISKIVTMEQVLLAVNNNYKKEIKYGRKRKDGSRKQS